MRGHYISIGCEDLLNRQYPKLGPGTVVETQLWDWFEIFGKSISLTEPPPFRDLEFTNN